MTPPPPRPREAGMGETRRAVKGRRIPGRDVVDGAYRTNYHDDGKVRCQYLSEQGEQCKARAEWAASVHEDPELSSDWFVVSLCQKHAEAKRWPQQREPGSVHHQIASYRATRAVPPGGAET